MSEKREKVSICHVLRLLRYGFTCVILGYHIFLQFSSGPAYGILKT